MQEVYSVKLIGSLWRNVNVENSVRYNIQWGPGTKISPGGATVIRNCKFAPYCRSPLHQLFQVCFVWMNISHGPFSNCERSWEEGMCVCQEGKKTSSPGKMHVRAVPEIILGGAHFFFRPLHPQDTHGVRAPRPPGHVSALINPPPLWIKCALTPRTSYPSIPPPLGHTVNKTPSPPPDKKVSVAHPPPG